MPAGSADKATIERYLAENELPYQRIELPHGLATPGPDRTGSMREVFPARLDGETLLDVGCYLGAFCHEAKRRGAAKVVGADVDPVRLRHAKKLAEFAGHDIEFRLFDADADAMTDTFDHVLFLNVLHHSKRPLETLWKVARLARKRLVLELPTTAEAPMAEVLRDRYGVRQEQIEKMESLPFIGVAPNLFYFNAAAIESLLLDHGRLFARVDVKPSPKPGRFVAICHRRRIGELLVIAGPSGVGKTHLLDAITAGKLPDVAKRLGLTDAASWTRVQNAKLREVSEPEVPRLLVHYDILRSHFAGARTFARDQALDVLECSEKRRIVTLFARRDVLLARFEKHVLESQGRRARRNERVRAFYARPHYLRDLYERWAAFATRDGVDHVFVDASDENYRVYSSSELGSVLSSVSA